MKLGLCIEGSTRQKVPDLERVLTDAGYKFINFGMQNTDEEPQLTYMHTGFLTALFINLHIVDFVVGGCGTGQGYMNAVLQYPGTACGMILDTSDAWLFSQINAGNVISLPLNKGYGSLGADIMVAHIIEKLFADPMGMGFPPHRAEVQRAAKKKLDQLSITNHLPMEAIVKEMDRELVLTSLHFPHILDLIQSYGQEGPLMETVLRIANT